MIPTPNKIVISGLAVSYLRLSIKINPKATIVLIHGWGGTKESWRNNLGEISKSFDCIALDLPGFGDSEEPSLPWGTLEYATFLSDFVKALKLKSVVIIGKSFGGRVATAYASKNPTELQNLILVSSAGIEEKSISVQLRIALSKLVPQGVKKILKQYLMKSSGKKGTSQYKSEVKKIVTNQDLKSLLPLIKSQALVVWGDQDKVLPLSYGQRIAKSIPNAQLKVINGGDHWVHERQPETFNQIVLNYLTK